MFRCTSATESPPNFSSTACASTSATIASATTPAAGTAQTSERWWLAVAASPVATSTVRRARGTVAMGFMPARTRRGPPVDMPPSMPPDRSETRSMPPGAGSISSCACEPRRRVVSKPSPTSTPLIAWMPMRAPARRESRRRSPWTNEPTPGGIPHAMTSTTPPSVSPARRASSTSATMRSDSCGSKQRIGSASRAATSSGPGRGASRSPVTGPIAVVCETSRMPSSPSSRCATVPSATRVAVSRAEALSSTGRDSSKSYFCMPTKSAWPGRGRVSFAARAMPSSSAGSTGSGLMTRSHLGHSVLPTSIATGPPSVRPWRTPPRKRISSASNFMRAPRP